MTIEPPHTATSVRCYTRALKNALHLKKVAPEIFDKNPSADGFGTGIPLELLRKLHNIPLSSPIFGRYMGLADVIREHPLLRPGRKGRDALFSGTIYFCQMTFRTSSGDKVMPTFDINQIIEYAQHAVIPIQAYAEQYGPNNVVISNTLLTKTVSVPSGSFTDNDLRGWVNELVRDNSLPGSSCVFVVCPSGIGAADVGDNAGYHNKGDVPYIVAGVYATGLTLADPDDKYAMVVSHEIAEMVVDPGVGGGDPEVCDPCDVNCNNLTRIYFDTGNNFVGSNQATPPGGISYSYFICAIVKPGGAANCPASSGDCAYSPDLLLYSGVWREGTDAYGLWIDADEATFLAKWSEWGAQNLRLTDLDVTTVNGRQLWSGVWESGTDAYGLWINSDEATFLAKWSEWGAQDLRLVSIKNYNGLWAGVWRGGADAYGLWINADEANFLAKWSEWGAQNLRLVDFEVSTTATGQRLWSGVWREGTDGYGLWINSDKATFLAKWSEWAGQNLRLVGLRTYDGLWAGIWREGTDAYGLWINADESSFLDKWGEWAGQNLRLIDLVTMPASGARAGRILAPAAASQGALVTASAGKGSGLVGRGGVHLGGSSGAASAGKPGGSVPRGGVHLGRAHAGTSAGEGGGPVARGGVHLGGSGGRVSAGEGGGFVPRGGVHFGRSGGGVSGGGDSEPNPRGGVHFGGPGGAASGGGDGGSVPRGGVHLGGSGSRVRA